MKKSLLLFILICSLCVLQAGGCGSSAPPPPQISVNLAPGSNQALDVNQSVSLTANVVNDTSGQGVTWAVVCPVGVAACGAMAQPKSASGAPNNFVSPANVSAAEMVTVTATSVSDPSQSKSILVTVNPAFALANPAPVQPQPGNVGTPFSFNLMSFVQGGTPPFTWSVKSGALPTGLTLNPSTGMVTGTPTAKTSTTAVSFNCTDSGIPPVSTPASIQISLAVNPGILAISPSTGGLPGGQLRTQYAGSAAGFNLTGSGGLTPYKWTWAAAAGSSLPPGLSFSSNADNTASIAGVPTTAASYNVVVTMTDAESPATTPGTANFTITVNPPPPLVISSVAPPIGHVGTLYNPHLVRVCIRWNPFTHICYQWQNQTRYGFTVTATGGVGTKTLGWAAVAPSSLPPGLNLTSGTISGTPPIDPKTAGSYNVSLTATDSGIPPAQTTANYSITIQNPPVPVINITPAPPAGAIGLPYSYTFTASQGLPSLTLTWSETGSLPAGLAFSNAGVLSGTPTATGTVPITIGVQDSLLQNATAQVFDIQTFQHGFKATGSMATPRYCHTATLLSNGKVLVTGGDIASAGVVDPTATAELYDPTTGSFSPTGGLTTARACATATLLSNGKVLVTGGYDATDNFLASSELYDPGSGSFSATGAMGTGRFGHTATLLNSGKVLVVGGASNSAVIATAELYDPAGTGSFSPTGSIAAARFKHTATLLSTGKVLVAGGADVSQSALATTELYDPTSGSFSPSGTMGTARFNHTATLLCDLSSLPCSDDRVLVTGGTNTTATELYDPAAGSFTATGSMGTARSFHTATLLKDGTVLVTGGQGTSGNIVAQSAELFNPTAGSFAGTGSMATPRNRHTATLLQNGKVLVTGGDNGTAAQASADLYQ
jgi:hypothetical protein